MTDYAKLLQDSFETVYRSAHPDMCIPAAISKLKLDADVKIIGAGKASAAMATAFERNYDRITGGLVITRYGHTTPTSKIKILEASHPIPDKAAMHAVKEMIECLENTNPNETIIFLVSGGGSALMTSPVEELTFEGLEELNKRLLKSGAPIQDMNVIRKHVNKVLGGKLAQYARDRRFITLAISDVTGDDPSIIASGATVPDPSTLSDAKAILKRYAIETPQSVTTALDNPENETPKPEDALFKNHEYHIIAAPLAALQTAAEFWKEHGFTPHILDAEMEGDTNECAKTHIDFINDIYAGKTDITLPCALISGGETTVKVRGKGQGGPNTQFMLQSAMLLGCNEKVYGMACDTDGIDGSADNAGAVITPETLNKAKAQGINAQEYLDDNDSYNFFDKIDGLVKTGPSFTNVNDYRVFLLLP